MKNQSGYTMVELLVVIAAMTILGIVGISNFASLQKDQAIQKTFANLQSYIRTAQTNATARVACPASSPATGGASWIVTFPTTGSMQFVCQLNPTTTSSAIRSYNLEGGTVIQNILVNSGTGSTCSATAVSITFAPLYGSATFSDVAGCGIGAGTTSIKIRLLNPATGTTKDLTIDKGGAVYEQ
jgi:prepilin-type N-terminal cleavage/methylation domain-containing protein